MRLGLYCQYVACPAFEIFLAIAVSHLKPHSLPFLIFRQYIKSSFSISLLLIRFFTSFHHINVYQNMFDMFHSGKATGYVVINS